MQLDSDQTLLEAIAQREDKVAFAELYERHKNAAYRVAYYVTGDRDLADEAVQEGMLSVWVKAGTFKPGNARGWILRIVAHKGAGLMRTKSRADRKESESMAQPREEIEASPEKSMELGEVHAALRDAVDALPMPDRLLLALHYGAGLTQREVAREVSLSQKTVSSRIIRTLESLKTRLTQAGFAGVAAAGLGEDVGKAILTGPEPPAALFDGVLRKVAAWNPAAQSQKLAASTQSASAAKVVLTIAAVGLVAAGAFTLIAPPKSPAIAPQAAKDPFASHILCDDPFDRPASHPFWKRAHPPERIVATRSGEGSKLTLKAGDAVVASGGGSTYAPLVEIITRDVEMSGQSLYYFLAAERPVGRGAFRYGFELLGQDGRPVLRMGRHVKVRSKDKYHVKEIYEIRGKDVGDRPGWLEQRELERFEAYGWLELPKRAGVVDSSSRSENSFSVHGATRMDTVRIRVYLEAPGGSSVEWTMDRALLTRSLESARDRLGPGTKEKYTRFGKYAEKEVPLPNTRDRDAE